jgi:hypothetical protein
MLYSSSHILDYGQLDPWTFERDTSLLKRLVDQNWPKERLAYQKFNQMETSALNSRIPEIPSDKIMHYVSKKINLLLL